MGKRDRERQLAIKQGKAQPHRSEPTSWALFKCGYCGEVVGELMVEEHLNKCAPAGAAICEKCEETIKSEDFVKHWYTCQGKKPKPILVQGETNVKSD